MIYRPIWGYTRLNWQWQSHNMAHWVIIHWRSWYVQATRAQDNSSISKRSSSNILYSAFPLRFSAISFMHSLISHFSQSMLSSSGNTTRFLLHGRSFSTSRTSASRFNVEDSKLFWHNFNQYNCLQAQCLTSYLRMPHHTNLHRIQTVPVSKSWVW